MTNEQILQLIYGANCKDVETRDDKDEKKLDSNLKKILEQKENMKSL